MSDQGSRFFAIMLITVFLLTAVSSVRGELGLYSPIFDNLFPSIRPVGYGSELTHSFMLPIGNYFEFIATSPASDNNENSKYRIVINTQNQTLTLYIGGNELKKYPVAVGKPRTPTPVGEWTIIHKSLNWGGGFGTRWMGLNVPWGIYGIHGTNKPYSIGTRASAGCIRMYNGSVEELFDIVPPGTRVDIVGNWPELKVRRTLRSGTTGKDVQVVQRALREIGLEAGRIDGRFGPQTEHAVRELQQFYGLAVDGVVNDDILFILGLTEE